MGKFGHAGRNHHGFLRRKAGFARLGADVHLQQDGLDDVQLGRGLLDGLEELLPIHRLDEGDVSHHLVHFIDLEVADEVDRLSGVGALGQLFHELLDAVFAAAVHARLHGGLDSSTVIHLAGGAE